MIERICQHCGKHFLTYHSELRKGGGKFCSRLCGYASRKIKVEKVCKQCGRLFFVKQSIAKRGWGEFCSSECYKKWRSAKSNIERVCKQCGKHFFVKHSQIEYGHGKFCSAECFAQYNSSKVIRTCEYCGREFWASPHRLKTGRGKFCSKKCSTQALRSLWQDPEFVKKMMLAFHKKPTKPEKRLEAILDKYSPEFKYNGDGRLGITLGGLTPDFVNINGKKDLIEVFGDYYHSPEVVGDDWRRSELGKVMVYNSLGWKCLVIWEHQLKELAEAQIVDKIRTFFKRKAPPLKSLTKGGERVENIIT